MKSRLLSALLSVLAIVAASGDDVKPTSKDAKKMDSPKVTKTDEEWRKKLTPEQYAVTRHAATEPAFGEAYEKFNAEGEGTYYCVCCGAELFTSKEKFHSGCGWPSFYDPSKAKNVAEHVDDSHGMRRVEVVCSRCDAHLGHVFEGEGYKTPTNRRFCINAAALNFVPKGGVAPKLEPVDSDKVKASKEAVKKAADE
jgi:peptide-methionine (R)-S-oxide reductase